jgi:hypothetical protein
LPVSGSTIRIKAKIAFDLGRCKKATGYRRFKHALRSTSGRATRRYFVTGVQFQGNLEVFLGLGLFALSGEEFADVGVRGSFLKSILFSTSFCASGQVLLTATRSVSMAEHLERVL